MYDDYATHLQRRQESLAIQIFRDWPTGQPKFQHCQNECASLSLSRDLTRRCSLSFCYSESWIPRATRQSCHIPGGYDCIALSLATFPRHNRSLTTATPAALPPSSRELIPFLFCNQSDPHRFPQERNNRREWIVTSWMHYKRVNNNFWLKNMFSHQQQQQLFYIHRWRLAVC